MNAIRWPEFCGDLVTGWDGVCWDSETWRTVGARCTTAAGRPIGPRCVEVERARCVGVEVERVTLVEAMPVERSEALAVELAPFVVIVPKASRRELWRVWRDALRSVFGEWHIPPGEYMKALTMWHLYHTPNGSTVMLVKDVGDGPYEYVILNSGSARPYGEMKRTELLRDFVRVPHVPGLVLVDETFPPLALKTKGR